MSAGKACKELQKLGFEQVYTLKGGINTWLNASLPLTKD
jgi:rhodanese-related sulfurtransferase